MAESAWTERLRDPPSKFSALPSAVPLSSGDNLLELFQGPFISTLPSASLHCSSSDSDHINNRSLSPFYKQQLNMNVIAAAHEAGAAAAAAALENSDIQLTHLGLHPTAAVHWPHQLTTQRTDQAEAGSSIHGAYNGSQISLPQLPDQGDGSYPSCYRHDPTPQLHALRGFLSQENFCTLQSAALQSSSMDLCDNSKLHLPLREGPNAPPGMSRLRSLLNDHHSGLGTDPREFLAYRTLCQAELFGTEIRAPQRNQFQRENHILAERQRREEMNEKFTALRAMIPKSLKKDKASIVGDTINYVMELEKTLKELQACKARRQEAACKQLLDHVKQPSLLLDHDHHAASGTVQLLFKGMINTAGSAEDQSLRKFSNFVREESGVTSSDNFKEVGRRAAAEVELHVLGEIAVIKMICQRSPGLVLRILTALEDCKVEVFQSNVTTLGDSVVHFLTVELQAGISAETNALIASLEQAAAAGSSLSSTPSPSPSS